MDAKITPSSGNVFRDLGFGSDEAGHLRIRSTLMIAVRKLIEDRGLTQAEAARLFGVTQPRISNLVRGRIDLFGIDTLIDMLAHAGVHIDVVLSPAGREPHRQARAGAASARRLVRPHHHLQRPRLHFEDDRLLAEQLAVHVEGHRGVGLDLDPGGAAEEPGGTGSS
jgi:predicted XRE-type DNA-binding protein